MSCILIHDWSPWGRPYLVGKIWLHQRRVCAICGKVQRREIGFCADAEDDATGHDDALTPEHPWGVA